MDIDRSWLDQHLVDHEAAGVTMPSTCCHFPGSAVEPQWEDREKAA